MQCVNKAAVLNKVRDNHLSRALLGSGRERQRGMGRNNGGIFRRRGAGVLGGWKEEKAEGRELL